MKMAKKDTFNALLSRDISQETAEKLLTKYNTLKSISEAGVSELVELGIDEAEAADVITKIGKKTSRPNKPKEKTVEEIDLPPREIIYKRYTCSETEKKIIEICEREGYIVEREGTEPEMKGDDSKNCKRLPLRIPVDIAGRIESAPEGTEPLSDEEIEKLTLAALDIYERRRMDSNESVGIMAAHSIGEPGTQMNMRTFHYAGVANVNVTTGLPRLIEIVDARKTPSTPSMTVPLVEMAAEDESVARHVAFEIESTTLLNVAELETDITNMRLIVKLNQGEMGKRGVTVKGIVDKLNSIKALRGLVEEDGFDITIRCDEPSYKRLQQIYDAAKAAKIKGIDGVSRAVLSKDDATGKWSIITEGSNLKEVMKIEGVDAKAVKTNSILEVADVLGIEAARNSLINEASETLSAAGTVDIRHIMLVADLMTNDGYIKAIGRHGISGRKSSVLARAAFEITAPHLLHAAMNGEEDKLEGVAENIIVGQPVTLGTGAVNLIYTPKKGDEQ